MKDGRKLRFFTDSGGGTQMIFPDVVARLGLPVSALLDDEGRELSLARIPEWQSGAGIPAPPAIHQSVTMETHYIVMPRKAAMDPPVEEDGFLGQGFLGGRVWTFDYVDHRLLLHEAGNVPPHRPDQEIPLHFPLADDGKPAVHFARITVSIDGESMDLLLDTGATLIASPAGASALGAGPERRATSFIAKTVFDRWRQKHPDWRIVERAERKTGGAIIEVPTIRIAEQEVGPVWFTLRSDDSFRKYMSSMMDAPVEGALGGSAFRYLRMTVDYPRRIAIFRR